MMAVDKYHVIILLGVIFFQTQNKKMCVCIINANHCNGCSISSRKYEVKPLINTEVKIGGKASLDLLAKLKMNLKISFFKTFNCKKASF